MVNEFVVGGSEFVVFAAEDIFLVVSLTDD